MPVTLLPEFVDAPFGQIFCLSVQPCGEPCGVLIHVPAFAEEMNKARRMTALAARRFAEQGWLVVLPDLYGTGDSMGDFGDASWDLWEKDLLWLYSRMQEAQPGKPLVWWGTRAGALLTASVARHQVNPRLLWWQPTPAGKQYLTQFLRLKLAGEFLEGDGSTSVDTQSLRQSLLAGETVEIAGYMLSPGMAEGLEQAILDVPDAQPGQIAWLEVSAKEPPGLLPAGLARMNSLRHRGWSVQETAVTGFPFWQSVEITEVPALIEASAAALKQLCALPEDSSLRVMA